MGDGNISDCGHAQNCVQVGQQGRQATGQRLKELLDRVSPDRDSGICLFPDILFFCVTPVLTGSYCPRT